VTLDQLWSGWLIPPSVSTYGPELDSIYYIILWVTGIIFVLTESALIFFSLRYRHKAGRTARYLHGNRVLEVVWTTIPTLILVYMALISQNLWAKLRQTARFPADAQVIKVVGEQWIWHFTYPGPDGKIGSPDDVNVDNYFHVPINQPVRLEATAIDVIHGFYLPDLRVHQDLVPGLKTSIWLEANQLGSFDLRCSQFCGTNHYEMSGRITVDNPKDYKAWLAKTKAAEF